MLTQNQRTTNAVLRVMDLAVISGRLAGVVLAQILRASRRGYQGFPSFSTYAALTPLIVVLWAIVLDVHGVYGVPAPATANQSLFRCSKAHAIALIGFVALTYIFSEYRYSRVVVLFFGLISGAGWCWAT
jgi:hypothetical protein